MKTKTNDPACGQRTRRSTNRGWLCALLALAAPLSGLAQQTVFYDTFGASTLEQTNIAGGIPGGTASVATPFSATSYTIASAKNALGSLISSGHLDLVQAATSSGNLDAAALFTKYPVQLAAVGDYVELTYTFTDAHAVLQSTSANTAGLFMGLYNSGGAAPQSGTTLANSGLSSSLVSADTGGTVGWLGYAAQMYNNSSWNLYTRPAETAVLNNLNQGLLYNYASGASHNGGTPGSPNLVPGQQYTCQLRVTLSAAGTLTVSNGLYTGAGTGGALFYTNVWAVTGANLLTTNFDSLAIGYRAGDSYSWTNDINSIRVVAGLAAQAGPYFFVGSTGNPCAGGVDITLSGSVTTNTYLLYTNGVANGQSLAGTGAALDFGAQTVPANYTVVASNPATGSTGPMYGSANVYAAGITMNAEPVSATVVTNLPASFSVQATGAALTYQWYKNGVALTNGGTISGAQTATLNISAVQAADGATAANGYTVVVKTPCGDVVTSTPPAALILAAPQNLIWAGGNPDNTWNYSYLNFTLAGSPTAFADGNNVIFDDTSAYQSVTLSNNLTPTLVAVTGTTSYEFSGPNKITGVARLVDASSGTLTIANVNDYTGGTLISNGATLALGDGGAVANNGSVAGMVTVSNSATLDYNFAGSANTTVNLNNALAGNGTVNCMTANGSTIATSLTGVSSNFTGTINIVGYTALHASSGNSGYALGNGSTINVPDNTQVWLDPSATAYNNIFNIGGTGWQNSNPYYGAMRVYSCTINGPINLQDNARIGGTISGATIQSVISGSYQLEVWGTTNSFVLVLGPTNGSPQGYASTLITAGSIQAANSNAISTGPLSLDAGGDLRLFGNNLAVSNLSSINSGQVLLIEGPRVRNMNTTNAATLTVGWDDSSTEFDGTFSDGAAAALGLTKVGNGTLTLTAVNTNSGAVTVLGGTVALSGSGSFGKAAAIAVASGATYDVSGAGGTLTLNSGQTLKGNGTVNGGIAASAGATVAPGLPMGTLTIAGPATLGGGTTYKPSLNRTNAAGNCSQLSASGVTFGGTLSVTNVGPALQVGDAFQLFGGATTGFTNFALQAYDYANSVNYTWANTVAANGKITVATVASRVLALQTPPTATVITYGLALSNSVCSGGAFTNAAGVVLAGTYAFTAPATVPDVGTASQSVKFTPTDATDYNAVTFNVSVTVNPQTPVLKTAPTASTITNGNPLSLSILTGGVVTNAFSTNVVAGTFAFTTPAATPGATGSQSVTFTPTDGAHYNAFTLSVNVTVVVPAAVTALKFTASPVFSGTSLMIAGTNTGAGTFYLLSSTNLAAARNTWTPIWTNVANGSSTFATNLAGAVNPAAGAQFYILSTTNNH